MCTEFSCWLFKEVFLKGYIYLTSRHLCFYSYLDAGDSEEEVRKKGFLTKKSTRTRPYSITNNWWFVLKGSVLRYYEDSQKTYFPLGTIDLKFVQKIEPSLEKETRMILFSTNSPLSWLLISLFASRVLFAH